MMTICIILLCKRNIYFKKKYQLILSNILVRETFTQLIKLIRLPG